MHLGLDYIDLLIHMFQLNIVSLEIYMSLSGLTAEVLQPLSKVW